MPRVLTDNERAVLAHVVVDPVVWWEHAQTNGSVDAEASLLAKVMRYQGAYNTALIAGGKNYQTRAERDATIGNE